MQDLTAQLKALMAELDIPILDRRPAAASVDGLHKAGQQGAGQHGLPAAPAARAAGAGIAVHSAKQPGQPISRQGSRQQHRQPPPPAQGGAAPSLPRARQAAAVAAHAAAQAV